MGEWIKLVGDQVKEWTFAGVDAISRVMVDDTAELPSSPLPENSSPLKRLQSSTGLPELTPQSRVAINRRRARVKTRNADPVAANTVRRDVLSGMVLVALCMGGLYLRFC